MSFIVRVDHLTDDQLTFFGWIRTHQGDEFSTYRCFHNGEEQVVSNGLPRYMVIDDVNDAQFMSLDKIITGPSAKPN